MHLTSLWTFPKLGEMTHLDYKKNSSFDIVRLPSYEWGSIFFKNSACISLHVPIDLGRKEFSQSLALSFRENGNNLSWMVFLVHVLSIKVLHTSSKSLMCIYGFLESIPWNVGRSWIMPGFKLKACWFKRQDNTRRCALSNRVKILPKSSKIRLIIELWRSITLNTPFTLYIFNISHDKKKI